MEEKKDYGHLKEEVGIYELWSIMKGKRKLISLITLSMLCIGVIYTLFAPKTYIIKSMIVANPVSEIGISAGEAYALTDPFKKMSVKEMAQYLTLDTATAKKFTGLKFGSVQKYGVMKIAVEARDINTGLLVMDKLLSYVNTGPLTQKKTEYKKQILEKNEDSLAAILSSPYKFPFPMPSSIIYDPLASRYALEEKYNSILIALDEIDKEKVALFAGSPIIPLKPNKPNGTIIIPTSIVFGLFLGIFIAFLTEWHTKESSLKRPDA